MYSFIFLIGVINPTNLTKICEVLSSLKIEDIEKLANHLNIKMMSSKNELDEHLFYVLYKWHRRNPTATKKNLALIMQECDLHKGAIDLDPSRKWKSYDTDTVTFF